MRREERKGQPQEGKRTLISVGPYCTFTALIRKSLIINGAGEGNRTLVSALISSEARVAFQPSSIALRRAAQTVEDEGWRRDRNRTVVGVVRPTMEAQCLSFRTADTRSGGVEDASGTPESG